jgi:hypothetical protein
LEVKRAIAACMLAACGATEESVTIAPVIDSPDDPNASVLDQVDSIRLTIEDVDGADVVPVSEFTRRSDIVVGGVPFADNLFIQIDAFNGATPIGVGRSCSFNVQRNEPPTPHIFLSRLGKAADLVFTSAPRVAGTAIATPDQKVLIVGGDNDQIERFDPLVNEFTKLEGATLATRAGASFALLGATAPRLAVFGGTAGGAPAPTIDVIGFDGLVDQFPDDGKLVARANAAAARLPNGDVLITGGRNLDGTASNTVAVVKLDESRNEARIDPLTTGLTVAREGHAMTQVGEGDGAKILITGGANEGMPTTKSEIFDPVTGNLVANLDPRFDLLTPRSRHSTFVMPDGSIIVLGGVDMAGNGVTTVEQFSPITGFMQATMLPMGAPVVDFALVTLPDGRGMIVGGRSVLSDTLGQRSIYLINFSGGGQISVNIAADALAIGRLNPQVAVLCDGTVLISGGSAARAVLERFNPNEPKMQD